MKQLMFALGLWILGGFSPAWSVTYLAPIESSQWYLSASIFECSLVHNVPRFGKAVFYHEAGEQLTFFLDSQSNPMAAGKAALVIEAPRWRPGQGVQDLGMVAVSQGKRPVSLNRKFATTMIAGLMDGMMPTFTRKAWYSDDSIRVSLNSVNFPKLYEDYLGCVAALLPVNFRQVERSTVLFEVDKAEMTEEDRRVLNRVILYVKADPAVANIYVDGHTDSSGRRIYNRQLSKDRAEAVTNYFIDHGIEPERITARYHGDRYPVVDNKNASSKARNRRTTVRIDRHGDTPVQRAKADAQDSQANAEG